MKFKPRAIDVLLGAALLAQAPHAMAVFARVAEAPDTIAAYAGGLAYALALEGATFYFVRNQQKAASYFFAFASVAMNVAYYMQPGPIATWTRDLRYWAGAAIICIALPCAIAAYSHASAALALLADKVSSIAAPQVAAKSVSAPIPAKVEKVAQRPAQAAKNSALTIDMQAAILDAIKCGASTQAAVAEVVGVHPTTIGRNIAPLRESGLIHRNGNGWEIGESA